MSIYGQSISQSTISPIVTNGQFIDFMFESVSNMNMIFEEYDLTVTSKPDESEDNTEKVKTSIIENIKKIISQFINLIKTGFEKLREKIEKIYLETNFVDKFVSKYKDVVTWQNIEKAKQNGWKGLQKKYALINKLADPTDSNFFKELQKETLDENDRYYDISNSDQKIDKIISAKNLEEAKKEYHSISKELTYFDSKINSKESDFGWNSSNGFEAYKDNGQSLYYAIPKELNNEGCYYPWVKGFTNVKMLAENGEKRIKQSSKMAKYFIKQLKLESLTDKNNMKSFTKSGSNYSDDKVSNQINILYYKAKYKYAMTNIKIYKRVFEVAITIIKNQHYVAIQTYGQFVLAIKKYATT